MSRKLRQVARGTAYPERPDVRWRNLAFTAWRASQPQPCDSAAKANKLTELSQQWRDMDQGQRAEALRQFDSNSGSRPAPDQDGASDDDDDDGEAVCSADNYESWHYGNDDFAVSPHELQQFLDARSPGIGVANRMQKIRFDGRGQAFVADDARIPASRSFSRRLACHEAHPGLCATEDSAVYQQALTIASSLERFFVAALLNAFCLLQGVDPQIEVIVHFCSKRARRSYAQVTHVFLPVVLRAGASYSLQRHPSVVGTYNFMSVWGLAKMLVANSQKKITAQVLCHRDDVNGDVIFPTPLQTHSPVEVWPTVYKQKRQPKPAAEAIDRLATESKNTKKKKPSGKIIYFGPGTAHRVHVFGNEGDGDLVSSDEDDDGDMPPDDGPPDGPSVDDRPDRGNREAPEAPARRSRGPADGEGEGESLGVAPRPPASAAAAQVCDAGVVEAGLGRASGADALQAHLGEAVGRRRRAIEWGPFQLAPIVSEGVQTGWGATCKKHCNAADLPTTTCCKKQVPYGSGDRFVDDATCLRLAKTWLVLGLMEVSADSATQRRDHVKINPRLYPSMTDAELDDVISGLLA